MKPLKFTFYCVIILMFTNCKTQYEIQKVIYCPEENNRGFNVDDVAKVERSLESMISISKYKLEEKVSCLELRTKSIDVQALQKTINKPLLVFKRIVDIDSISEDRTLKLLSTIETFRSNNPEEELGYYLSNTLGFVETEEEMSFVNDQMKSKNCTLSAENLFWFTHPVSRNKEEKSRYYLLATSDFNKSKLDSIPYHIKEVIAGYDYETFEPCVRLILNDCGVSQHGQYFSGAHHASYAIVINERVIAVHWIRIRNENEISIRGFKTFDEAKLTANLIASNTLSVLIN